MDNRHELNGYVETEGGLLKFKLIFEHTEFYAFYLNDELDDTVMDYEDVIGQYGEYYYETTEDFKADRPQYFDEWLEKLAE